MSRSPGTRPLRSLISSPITAPRAPLPRFSMTAEHPATAASTIPATWTSVRGARSDAASAGDAASPFIILLNITPTASFVIRPAWSIRNVLMIDPSSSRPGSPPSLAMDRVSEQTADAAKPGSSPAIFSRRAARPSSITSTASWRPSPRPVRRVSASSYDSGRSAAAFAIRDPDMVTGGMSVSGYMRAAPGRGRMNLVVPSSSAALVSAGAPPSLISPSLESRNSSTRSSPRAGPSITRR